MHTWGPTRARGMGRGEGARSRARKWLRLSGFNRVFGKCNWLWAGPLSLGWYRLCNAPMASRWYRRHHTQGGCSKGITALLMAELEFGFRILSLPPSQQPLPVDRCWHSRGNLCAIPSSACFTCCHLCHVMPHCWSENSGVLV